MIACFLCSWCSYLNAFLIVFRSYGETPFKEFKNADVQRLVREGLRLEQLEGVSDEYYAIAYQCWIEVCCAYRLPSFNAGPHLITPLLSI